MTKEQAKAGRLSFDDEGNQMVKGAGMKPGGTAGKYIATQAVISGMKAVTSEEEETDENAGVESARLAERETEAALRGLRHAQIRDKRTDVKIHRRGYREATVEKKLKFGSAESMEGVKHAESVKNAEQKRHFYNRFFQKNDIRMHTGQQSRKIRWQSRWSDNHCRCREHDGKSKDCLERDHKA